MDSSSTQRLQFENYVLGPRARELHKGLPTDAEIRDMYGVLSTDQAAQFLQKVGQPDKAQRLQELVGYTQSAAQEMGMNKVEVHILVPGALGKDGAAANVLFSAESKESTGHIFIRSDVAEELLSSKEDMAGLKGMVGHELAHLAARDSAPRAVAEREYIAQVFEKHPEWDLERRADLVGAGPLGSHDPKTFAEAMRASVIGLYNSEHPETYISPYAPSNADMQKVGYWQIGKDPQHPDIRQRTQALEKMDGLMKAYEAEHHVVSHEDRVREAKWLEEQMGRGGKEKTVSLSPNDREDKARREALAAISAGDASRLPMTRIAQASSSPIQTPTAEKGADGRVV